jgi:hypothetical protein
MWNRPLACHVEETLRLQLAFQCLQFSREETHPPRSLHACGDELVTASRAIQINAAADNDDLSDGRRLFAGANCSTEAHHVKRGLFISQREVLMAGRAAHGALHLASNDAIG